MPEPQRWECRYSSSEMLYLELRGRQVVTYLDHSPRSLDRYSFDEVLAGKHDAMLSQFGAAAPAQVKTAIVMLRLPPLPTRKGSRRPGTKP